MKNFLVCTRLPQSKLKSLLALPWIVWQRSNISVTKLRGQCYDGASNMSGVKSGVAKKFKMKSHERFSHIAMAMPLD